MGANSNFSEAHAISRSMTGISRSMAAISRSLMGISRSLAAISRSTGFDIFRYIYIYMYIYSIMDLQFEFNVLSSILIHNDWLSHLPCPGCSRFKGQGLNWWVPLKMQPSLERHTWTRLIQLSVVFCVWILVLSLPFFPPSRSLAKKKASWVMFTSDTDRT